MEKNLTVPILRQAKNSIECGIVSLEMVYAFYGIKISHENICQEISFSDIGTYMPQLGGHAIVTGFHSTIITHNPRLIYKEDEGLSQDALLDRFMQLDKTNFAKSDVLCLSYFIDFIQKHGRVLPKIPDIDDIRSQIDLGRPLIALINSAPLYTIEDKNSFNDTFHIVVVTGYDEIYVYINDPIWNKHGGAQKYAHRDFFFALYASSLGDFDNGSLLTLTKV